MINHIFFSTLTLLSAVSRVCWTEAGPFACASWALVFLVSSSCRWWRSLRNTIGTAPMRHVMGATHQIIAAFSENYVPPPDCVTITTKAKKMVPNCYEIRVQREWLFLHNEMNHKMIKHTAVLYLYKYIEPTEKARYYSYKIG